MAFPLLLSLFRLKNQSSKVKIWWQDPSSGLQTMWELVNIPLKLWNVSAQLAALGQEAPISPEFLRDCYHHLYQFISQKKDYKLLSQEQIKKITDCHLSWFLSLSSGMICYHVQQGRSSNYRLTSIVRQLRKLWWSAFAKCVTFILFPKLCYKNFFLHKAVAPPPVVKIRPQRLAAKRQRELMAVIIVS